MFIDQDFYFIKNKPKITLSNGLVVSNYDCYESINTNFKQDILDKLKITYLTVTDGIAYVDLDAFTDIENFETLYNMYLSELKKIIDYCYTRALIYTNNYTMINKWNLRPAIDVDFQNFTKLTPPTYLDLWIVNPQLTDVKIQVVPGSDLYFPINDLPWEFYKDRLNGEPYYYDIGPNSVVWHYIAEIFENLWIIDNMIEVPMKNIEDLENIELIKQAIVSAIGTVKISETEISGYASKITYYLGKDRTPQISYLFST